MIHRRGLIKSLLQCGGDGGFFILAKEEEEEEAQSRHKKVSRLPSAGSGRLRCILLGFSAGECKSEVFYMVG